MPVNHRGEVCIYHLMNEGPLTCSEGICKDCQVHHDHISKVRSEAGKAGGRPRNKSIAEIEAELAVEARKQKLKEESTASCSSLRALKAWYKRKQKREAPGLPA